MSKEKEWTDMIQIIDWSTNTLIYDNSFVSKFYLRQLSGYEMAKTIYVPLSVKSTFKIKLISNFYQDVFELTTTNNEYSLNRSFRASSIFDKLNLTIEINNDQIAEPIQSNQLFSLDYNVCNKGAFNLPFTYWTDSIYLISFKPTEINQITKNGIFIGSLQRMGEFKVGSTLTQYSRIIFPSYLLNNTKYFLTIIFDSTNQFQQINLTYAVSSLSLLILNDLYADLRVSQLTVDSSNISCGTLLTGSFSVFNEGNMTAFNNWYDTVYLSEDAIIDQFDKKVFISKREYDLKKNSSYIVTFSFNTPLNLKSSFYYLIVSVDNTKILKEASDSNNYDKISIFIKETLTSDLSVWSVKTNQLFYQYEDNVDFDWIITNKGSLNTEGNFFFNRKGGIIFIQYKNVTK